MQLANNQKQVIVTNIKNSNTFKNAPTSIALLQYLHEATMNDIHLKEGVIEIEFFGSKETSKSNSPRVRVNVYNLRKKLTAYYKSEGKDDRWCLTIDKGQYQVRFFKRQTNSIFNKKLNWLRIFPYVALLVAVSFLYYTNCTPKPPSIWQTFISNNTHTILFIGDHFGATGKTATGGNGWTRDFSINSVSEFYALMDKKPELKNDLKPATYSYTTRMAALAVQQFQQFYQKYDKSFEIRFSTQTSISEIKEGYAIYAGPTKNNNQFIRFFNEGNPYLKISNDTLILSNHPTLKNQKINIKSPSVTEEFAIVSKYPSINNTEHFVFFSQHDIGVSATVEYFTNVDSLKNFKNNYLKDAEYFTAIFKVKGQDRTNTAIKLETIIAF